MRISKLIAAVIGIPMVVASLALAIGGGIAMAVPDDDGWVSAGPVRLETDSAALVGDDIEIDFGAKVTHGRTIASWGEIPTEIEITSRNEKPVFIGIAATDDADAYLAGVARDRLTSFDHDHDLEFLPGVYQATPPADADIWVASSVDGLLEWDIQPGDWALVAVNADGSPGIDINAAAAAKVSFLRPLGAVILAGGVLGMGAGIALTYFGVRREPTAHNNTSVPPSATAGPIVTS